MESEDLVKVSNATEDDSSRVLNSGKDGVANAKAEGVVVEVEKQEDSEEQLKPEAAATEETNLNLDDDKKENGTTPATNPELKDKNSADTDSSKDVELSRSVDKVTENGNQVGQNQEAKP